MKKRFFLGLKDSIPISMGYIAVSFSFGMAASAKGLPVWVSVLLSAFNLTSAGQLSSMELMTQNAPLMEIIAATFVINIRYLLMSLVLSQRIVKMSIFSKMSVAFGITDEIFTLSTTKKYRLHPSYMMGLICGPYVSWTMGTLLGASMSNLVDTSVAVALGICIYAMFTAIVIPEAMEDKAVRFTAGISVIIMCIFEFGKEVLKVSSGKAVIIASLVSAGLAAYLYPRKREKIDK